MQSHSQIEQRTAGESQSRRIWIILALVLVLAIVVASILDFLFEGIPLSFPLPLTNSPATVSGIVYRATVAVIGSYIAFIGLKELVLEKKFSIEFLMSAAAIGAIYLGFLFEAASVLILYSIAEYFENYIEDKARKTVEKLSRFMPEKATVVIGSNEKSMYVKEIKPGSEIVLRPGERIPLDGVIVEGSSSVDQSLITGESAIIRKKSGDEVYAGTLNLNGVLRVLVRRGAEDMLVSRIVRLVMDSRKRKASVEKLVDRFARFYIPVVIAVAVFTVTVLPLIVGGSFETWLYRSLILLVISCPSAFVISVPATVFTAVAAAARRGAIVKGGMYIEKLAEIKAVIFDKTGTLTFGEPVVHNMNSLQKAEEQALTYAAALEQYSHHPFAQTIVKKAKERNLQYCKLQVKDVHEVPGKGIVGYVDDIHVAVGNMELMSEYACNCSEIDEIYEKDEHAFMCISIEKTAVAAICVTDKVRQDAVRVVKTLKESNIHTAMLTGDKAEIAEEISQTLGIDESYAELFPEDKLRIMSEIRTRYGQVAMVGDGVNDAPTLAASDVGIAMGMRGVDVALDSADVVLVNDKLIQIPYLIGLSKKTVKIAKQNIAFSLTIKIVLGALGLIGFIPLWFAVASGDDGLTMLVLLNTLRLTRLKS